MVPKNTMQRPWPRLEPGPLELDLSVLTMTLNHCIYTCDTTGQFHWHGSLKTVYQWSASFVCTICLQGVNFICNKIYYDPMGGAINFLSWFECLMLRFHLIISLTIKSFRRNHEQTSSRIHGIHLSSARRSFDLLNYIRHQEVISKVCSCHHTVR